MDNLFPRLLYYKKYQNIVLLYRFILQEYQNIEHKFIFDPPMNVNNEFCVNRVNKDRLSSAFNCAFAFYMMNYMG